MHWVNLTDWPLQPNFQALCLYQEKREKGYCSKLFTVASSSVAHTSGNVTYGYNFLLSNDTQTNYTFISIKNIWLKILHFLVFYYRITSGREIIISLAIYFSLKIGIVLKFSYFQRSCVFCVIFSAISTKLWFLIRYKLICAKDLFVRKAISSLLIKNGFCFSFHVSISIFSLSSSKLFHL